MSSRTVARPVGVRPQDVSATDYEMFAPDIVTWMEHGHNRACIGIDTREVRPFVCIATVTGESEVVGNIRSTMLLGYNMLDVKGNEWCRFLRNSAVFTGFTGTLSDKLSRARIDFHFRRIAFRGTAGLLPV